jgi:hypothetical protein
MAGGHKSDGFKTERGRMTIVGARTSNGATCFSPVLPGETEEHWNALLDGMRQRFEPADKFEEQLVYHLALSFQQALRLHRYEKAALRQQTETAAEEGRLFGAGKALGLVLSRGVESIKAELRVMEKALGLIGAVAFAGADDPLPKEDGLLLLRLAVNLVLKGKSVERAFSGLPEDGWTWSVVQENLTELCQAAKKSMSWLLKVLHNYVLEEVATLRKTLEEGLRGLETNYTLATGETERLVLYHSRLQNTVAKWLALLGQSKADRLGLMMIQPPESHNGDNGDAALE